MNPGALWSTIAAVAVLHGCIDVPGMTEGGPCNAKNTCTKGLVCEEGICKPEGATSWELMSTVATETLFGVWGTSDTDVIAVGNNGTILRYTGGAEWQKDAKGIAAAAEGTLRAVWGRNENDIWAVGNPSSSAKGGLILHWTGSAWERQPAIKEPGKTTDMPMTLSSVAGAPGTPLYVVGNSSVGGYAGLVLKLDGTWIVMMDTGLGYAGQGVAVAGKQVFVAGMTKAVRFFDGSAWTERALPGSTALDLNTVFAWDESNVIAGGSASGSSSPGRLVRFDGSTWEDPAFEGVKSFTVHGAWGSTPQDYFLVGEGSTSSVLRCSDSGCSPNIVPAEAKGKQLNAVWGTETTVFAVGEGGIILRRAK